MSKVTEHLSLQGLPFRVLSYSAVAMETSSVSMTTDLQISGTSWPWAEYLLLEWPTVSILQMGSGRTLLLEQLPATNPLHDYSSRQPLSMSHRCNPLQHFKLRPLGRGN